MINRVLIANRGEIACRVIRTLDQMGIESVAVFSDADREALHVSMADQSIRIGPAPSVESYLRSDRIIQAALNSGADAIHPGYGFLSENPEFVHQCVNAGLVFIGPDAASIEAMGLKDTAKKLMQDAGVPVVPGYHGENQNPDYLAGEADQIGYPVLIKARAGGGGKGMRKVDSARDFVNALEGAKREAAASFADDRVLIEKYLTTPRHIEVQVFGDRQGTVLHLFERDCSLQRRHQKVIEEAPAPGMTEEMRTAMGNAAVQAAKAVNYIGAGTVEFIVDASDGLRPDRFFFMEMNTRLQVEHPVTEFVTGIDLVEWQINVAAGKALPLSQQQLSINGHALEARIYAEDTDNDFLPATGKLDYLQLDSEQRVDTGVRQGDRISPFYDPMIAKLIVKGEDRATAVSKLIQALGRSRISGCTNNIDFLARLASLPEFISGEVQTGLIEQQQDKLGKALVPPTEVLAIGALHQAGLLAQAAGMDPWQLLTYWRPWRNPTIQISIRYLGDRYEAQLELISASCARLTIENMQHELKLGPILPNDVRLLFGERWLNAGIFAAEHRLDVFLDGESWQLDFDDPLEIADDNSAAANQIISPMPGAITHIPIKSGDPVSQGDILIVMEAMKMEHSLKAGRDGVIQSVSVGVGDQVEAGTTLATLTTDTE
ncbi:MAG: acetyl/propionyl/methylcrotonyl-CoA carboxylase subunit alpha [bacterium]